MTCASLLELVDAVRDTLAAEGVAATVVYGRREPAKQINGVGAGRVAFVRGDDGGAAGDLKPPRSPGGYPARTLWRWHEHARVYVRAYDATQPEDEAAQYAATRVLLQWVVRSIHEAAFGKYAIGAPRWVESAVERQRGEELVFQLALETELMAIDWPGTPGGELAAQGSNSIVTGGGVVPSTEVPIDETVTPGCACAG